MEYNTGNKIRVNRRRLEPLRNTLIGLEGTITKIDNSIVTEEEKRQGFGFNKLEVRAINFGPYMKTLKGEKKVFAWIPDDKATFLEEEVMKINET